MAVQLGRIFSQYCLVTLLPAFVVSTIYLDYNRTLEWKRKLKEEKDVSDNS